MKANRIWFTGLLCLGACGGDDHAHGPAGMEPESATHTEEAPHGGELIELGQHVAHLEVVHDESAASITVYVLDADLKPLALAEAPVLNLPAESGLQQITGVAADTANTQWSFKAPSLAGEPEGARFRVVLNGVTYTPELHHDH